MSDNVVVIKFAGTIEELYAKLGGFAGEYVAPDPQNVINATIAKIEEVNGQIEAVTAKWTAKLELLKDDADMVQLIQTKMEAEVKELEASRPVVPSLEEVTKRIEAKKLTHTTDAGKRMFEELGFITGSIKNRQPAGNSDGKFDNVWAREVALTKDHKVVFVNRRALSDAQKARFPKLATAQDWLVKIGDQFYFKTEVTSPNQLVVFGRALAGLSVDSQYSNKVWNEAPQLTDVQIATI